MTNPTMKKKETQYDKAEALVDEGLAKFNEQRDRAAFPTSTLIEKLVDDVVHDLEALDFNSPDARSVVSTVLTTLQQATREETLEKYTQFLLDKGYCDADVYAEEPKAIDAYLSTLSHPTK
jgi:hypothetical protein